MTKLIVFILATSMVILVAADDRPASIKPRVEIVQDIAAFKAANLAVELIPLDIQSVRQEIVYSVGSRVKWDYLVASDSNVQSWPSLQDVVLTLNHPWVGTKSTVTYVVVVVNQSTNQGRGYITSGGIGQRSISVVIEAYNTDNFSYNVEIYGYESPLHRG